MAVCTSEFWADACDKQTWRKRLWQQQYLLPMLEQGKLRGDRDIDTSIALGEKLIKILEEKVTPPRAVLPRELELTETDDLMKPVEPHLLDIIYGSELKGAGDRYLRERNKKSPEEKYYFREQTSWDYGWHQKSTRVPPRDVNHGRCAILRDTFYRKNNLAPDPPHYAQPSGGEVSICSEYSCSAN